MRLTRACGNAILREGGWLGGVVLGLGLFGVLRGACGWLDSSQREGRRFVVVREAFSSRARLI
jgi:hypothetical protein